MNLSELSVVYVNKGESEELRYSLRSLKNLPHKDVWIVGDKPTWANVNHVKRKQTHSKYEAVRRNIDLICKTPEITEDFILLNNDFFIMKPVKHLNYHRGDLSHLVRSFPSGDYQRNMKRTWLLLDSLGIANSLSYELHIPMVINKKLKREASKVRQENVGDQNIHLRTLYGNLFNLGGREIKDVKVYNDAQPIPKGNFISTTEETFTNCKVGQHIRNTFKEKSPYENY